MNENFIYDLFKPRGETRGVVLIVHGMQEHRERYEKFINKLLDQNYAVVSYDLPGHGHHEELGYFGNDGWNKLVESINDGLEVVENSYKHKVPTVIFSHSMGTMLMRTFMQENDDCFDALVLSGAPNYNGACKIAQKIGEAVCKVQGDKEYSKLMETMALGTYNKVVKNPRTNIDWLSYNNENVDNYMKDDLCGFPFTNRGYLDLFYGMDRMHDKKSFLVKNPNLPILMIAGHDDPCIGGEKGFSETYDFLKSVGYLDITRKLEEHMRHEMYHEVNGERVMDEIIDWINVQIEKK